MKVFNREEILRFQDTHSDSVESLSNWYQETCQANWASSAEVRSRYPRASILDKRRVVFRIKGNHYRLLASIYYDRKVVYIEGVWTHAEYDKITL